MNAAKRLEEYLWRDGIPQCPYCFSKKSSSIKLDPRRYHCNGCFTSYSVTAKTLFHRSHLSLEVWFEAIQVLVQDEPQISIRKLAERLGVNKNTAQAMIEKIFVAKRSDPQLISWILEINKCSQGVENV